jgi:hypothetical protein
MKLELGFVALLYHSGRPCANPAERIMMNTSKLIGVDTVAARIWLTD